MIVIDSSALVEALAGDAPADELLARVAESRLHIPYLLDYEFRNAMRGLLLGGKISEARAEGARTVKAGLPFIRHADDLTADRAWDLRANFNGYDATYVALAEMLDCVLVTTDEKIYKVARKYIDVDLC
ncbi:type II toxin-antitoxin system VapC family toxin [Nonomuraea sp. 3-1Str]|uniref:type II toxin-antitoxin system VapC family toxin n=1 Tax=Nonomuraea sp. 3-1Str TaxID=2929801 RepID=UPI0028555F38|nr:type II toxin-antitoxin system VapC family toxin [Nonomuraea sp. 3-1Str]MDR8413938.1 type II toxin-antitoxin system VapC family toxin [Nonomuraea sp. 3-1Str]